MIESQKTKNYAGFWIRTWATMIDIVLLMAITMPTLLWAYGPEYFDPESPGGIRGPFDFLISYVLPTVAVILLWKFKSATPGKMLLGVKIADAETGEKPSDWQFFVRYFAYLVSTLPLCLGFLWIAVDRRKQAWHDKLAGTVVVRERKNRMASAGEQVASGEPLPPQQAA